MSKKTGIVDSPREKARKRVGGVGVTRQFARDLMALKPGKSVASPWKTPGQSWGVVVGVEEASGKQFRAFTAEEDGRTYYEVRK